MTQSITRSEIEPRIKLHGPFFAKTKAQLIPRVAMYLGLPVDDVAPVIDEMVGDHTMQWKRDGKRHTFRYVEKKTPRVKEARPSRSLSVRRARTAAIAA